MVDHATRDASLENAKLSAAALGADLITEGPRDWCFMMHGANSYRWGDTITLVQRDEPWLPGMFLTAAGAEATSPGTIAAINACNMNTRAGPRSAAVVSRDTEVADAYLQYKAMDPAAVATQLATKGIIVRQAILPNVQPGSFDPNVSGPPSSGIPPATAGASYTPDTLEAAEPAQKADDHGRVSGAEQAQHKAEVEKRAAAAPHPAATPAPHSSDTGSGTPHRAPRPPRGENP